MNVMPQDSQQSGVNIEDADEITQYLVLSNLSRSHSCRSKLDSGSHVDVSFEEDGDALVESTISPSSGGIFEKSEVDDEEDTFTQYYDLPTPRQSTNSLQLTNRVVAESSKVNNRFSFPSNGLQHSTPSSLFFKSASNLCHTSSAHTQPISSICSNRADTRLSLLKKTKERLTDFSDKVTHEIQREEVTRVSDSVTQLSEEHHNRIAKLQLQYENLYNERALELYRLNEKRLQDLEETFRLKFSELESKTMERFLLEKQKCEESLNVASSRFSSMPGDRLSKCYATDEHNSFLLELHKEKMWIESRMKQMKYLYHDYRTRLSLVNRAIDQVAAPILKKQSHFSSTLESDNSLNDPLFTEALKENVFLQEKVPPTHRSDDGYSSHSQIDCDIDEGMLPTASSTLNRPRRIAKSFPPKTPKEAPTMFNKFQRRCGEMESPENVKLNVKKVTLRDPQESMDDFLSRVLNDF